MSTDVERWKPEVYSNEIQKHLLELTKQGWGSIPEDERDAWFEHFKW